MVRIRSHAAAACGFVAAIAVLGLPGARAGQTYSIVGQSTEKTAATGRRPLAERIKAANRPIRITPAEAALAPDEGLIRGLTDAETEPSREWPLVPPVVELPEAEPITAGIDVPASASEPAIVPPPAEEALAARPTTAGDPDDVGEVGGLDAPDAETPAVVTAEGVTEERAPVAAPRVAPMRSAPVRRSVARVTPQRREALLSRLRAALADMPRPFGLVPAPAPAPRPVRRTFASPAPMAAAVETPSTEPTPAVESHAEAVATATDTSPTPVESAVADTDVTSVADPAAPVEVAVDPVAPAAPEETTAAEANAVAADAILSVDSTLSADAILSVDSTLSADAPLATPPTAVPLAETSAAVPAETGPATAEPAATDVAVDASVADENDDATVAVSPAGQADESPAEEPATPPVAAAATAAPRAAATPRRRAPPTIVQRPRPFGRLQATLESLPRPLGILPAPRPTMHAAAPKRRNPAAAVARTRPQAAPASAPDGDRVAPSEALATEGATGTPTAPESVPESAAASESESAPESAAVEEVACIEVTIEGPEGTIDRGEDVTLHLTVRNTGTVAARGVRPMFHFGDGIEPKGTMGRVGTVTESGSVVFDTVEELAPGECIEVDVVASCTIAGTVPFQGVVWCGEGATAEQVPVDGRLEVVPGRIAAGAEGTLLR